MRLLAAILICGLVYSVESQGTTSGEDFVRIIAKSTIVYNVGDIKAIYCNSSLDPIEWYSPQNRKIGTKSNKNTRIYVEKRIPERGVPFIIHNLQISDGGNYTCKAGELTTAIDVFVGEKVKILETNVNLEGEEGRSIVMKCESKGYPAPVVVWYRENSQPIPSNNKHKYEFRADENYNMLEIKKLDHMDVGDYVCKVRQKRLSHYAEKIVHLSVQHKPVLYNSDTNSMYTAKAEEVYAIRNETKNITCSAIANPQPEYHWVRRRNGFDGNEITDPDKVIHSEDGKNSVLVLSMHDNDDLGEYKCTAINAKGKKSVIYHVTYGNKPNPPDFIQLAVANVTEFVFNVTCVECPLTIEDEEFPNPQNLIITGYSFQLVPVKEPYDPDWDAAIEVEVPIVDPNETLFNVGPLANKTKYHVRVRSVNAAGYSEWLTVEPDPETASRAIHLVTTTLLIIAAYIFTLFY